MGARPFALVNIPARFDRRTMSSGVAPALAYRHACCPLRVMKHDQKLAYTTRNDVLKLLSDEEVARVSTAEASAGLVAGDEYLDLEQLERGVLRAPGPSTPMGRVLSRKSVGDSTWRRILTQLGASHPDAPPARR